MFFCLLVWILCLLHLKAGKGAGGHAFGLLGPHLIYYVRTHSDDDDDDGDDDDNEDDADDNDDNGDGDNDDQAKPKFLDPWNQVPRKWRDREEIGRQGERKGERRVGVGDGHRYMHRLHDVLQFFETSLKNPIVKNKKHCSKHCIVKNWKTSHR